MTIPAGWQRRTFAEICKLITDGTHKTPKYQERGIPFVSTANLRPYGRDFDFDSYSKFISGEEHSELTKRAKPEKGDVLVSKCGTIGRTQVVRVDYDFSIFVGLMLLKVRNELVIPEFLEFYLNQPSVTKDLKNLAVGSSRSTLTIKSMKEFSIPLPPLSAQKRLVAVLERAETVRQLRKHGNQMANRIVQSVFLKMFGDPLKNSNNWNILKLSSLSTRITKGESPKWQGFSYVDDGPLFIRSTNVGWGFLDLNLRTRIPHQFHQKLYRSRLKPNDVLINLVGASIGRAAVVPDNIEESNINQAVAVISTKTELDPIFLLYFLLNSSVQGIIHRGKVDAARANISLTDLRSLNVPLPPISLQKKFSSFVMKVERTEHKMVESANEIDSLYSSLVHKAFRGELTLGEKNITV